ncbi:MAG: LpqB family beta-propeller domain-containing protein [Chloroflexaceae bacterium]
MSAILQSGTMVHARYRIVRLIGQGGMGAVYAAVDQTFGSQVALKQMFPTPNLAPQAVANLERAFQREAHLLHQLRHPALPRVTDHFSEANGRFLVMDYIDGEDLAHLLEQRMQTQARPLTEQEVVPWAIKVLEALEYLHSHRPPIIHRDIKPHNIKVTTAGDVFLIDFGIAKGASTQQAAIGHRSVFVYTPAYASLEQIQGMETDPRSDLFSLGATMYHLLRGSAPDAAPRCNALTRAAATVRNQPDPLTPPPGASLAVQEVIMQALALDPDHRPASATVMRQALERAIGAPVQTPHMDVTVVPPGPQTGATILQPRPDQTALLQFSYTLFRRPVPGPVLETLAIPVPVEQALPVKRKNRVVLRTGGLMTLGLLLLLLVGMSAVGSANNMAPAWSPDGTRIAFVSERTGTREIYVANADGSRPQRLTYDNIDDSNPVWSPSSRRIAFETVRDGESEIYISNADGSAPDRPAGPPYLQHSHSPAWSPDGRRIAFVSAQDGNQEIYVVNAGGYGSDLQRLTDNAAAEDSPVWSPDGTRIAFVSAQDDTQEIYAINADGSNLQRLTDNAAGIWNPVWSPDGTRIAFETMRDGNQEIYVINADGSNLQRLTHNDAQDWSPAWSPVSMRIAFVSNRNGTQEIYVMDADGSNLQRLTFDEAEDAAPTWSPDGTHIAFESRHNDNQAIYVMNADGSDRRRLAVGWNWLTTWLP